ncbi:MAG: ankyrin repeat domain-containing protein, partial [Planctomycetota bacterium]
VRQPMGAGPRSRPAGVDRGRPVSGAARQLLWLLALAGVLALPILSAALPDWRILPEWADPTSASRWEPAPAAAPPASIEADPYPAPPGIDLGAHDPPGPLEPVTADAPEASPPPAPILSAQPPAAEARTWSARDLLPIIPLVWIVGMLTCLAPQLLGRLSLWRLRRRSRPLTDGPWPALMAEASGRLGLTRPVQLLTSSRRTMPMIWGIFRPALLLPAEAQSWTPDRRRVVLLHELAHARRRDCLTKLIAQLACAVYWFNPLVWIASAMGQRESERACDDLVLAAGSRPADYAEHILGIASGLQSPVLAAHSGIAMARRSRLEGRLLAILDRTRNRRRLTLAAILVAAVLVGGIVVPLSVLSASDGEKSMDKAAMKAKERADLQQLGPDLDPLLKRWFRTWPRRAEDLATYDVTLLIDVGRRMVAIERGGVVSETVTLPEGYDWKVLRATPARAKKLTGVVRLKIRHHRLQKNICKEVILVQGVLGPEDGLHFDIKAGLGWSIGNGVVIPDTYPFPERKHRPRPGWDTIDQSLLVGAAPPTVSSIDELWDELRSADYAKAFRAARTMSGRGDKAARWLDGRLSPVPSDPKWIAGRIAELGSDRHAVRTRAAEQLATFGPGAKAALQKALPAAGGAEARIAIKTILTDLDKPVWTTPAGRRMDWAVRVLEAIDTPASRQTLAKLAGGHPQAMLTRLAAEAASRAAELDKADAKVAPALLAFRLLARPYEPNTGFTGLKDAQRQKYLAALKAGGPVVDRKSNDNFRWVELACPASATAFAADWKGKSYLLVGNTSPRGVGEPFARDHFTWELLDVRVVADESGAPAIEFVAGRMVADGLQPVLRPHHGQHVAFVIDGRAVAIGQVDDLTKDGGRIAGLFSARRARAIVKSLEAGMAPVRALGLLAAEGKIDEVRKLLDARPDLVRASIPRGPCKGDTALHKAVANDRRPVVELLLRRGADPNAANARGQTPLHEAIRSDSRETVELLLAHKADLTAEDAQGFTPLHMAVMMYKPEMAALLIDHGADVNAKGKGGMTPLAIAVMLSVMYGKNNPCIALLGEKGARTDIFTAAALGKVEQVRAFLKADPQAARAMAMGRISPLHIAAAGGHEEVARILLDAGADVEAGAGTWVPPLTLAAGMGHANVVNLLLDSGAGIDAKDGDGGTPLGTAAYQGRKDIVKLLLDRGAAANTAGRDSPLAHAVKGGQKAVAELLIARGAKVNGELLVYLARQAAMPGGPSQAVKPDRAGTAAVLIDHGADVNHGAGKTTALHNAVKTPFNRKPDPDLIRLLLKRGADVHARDSRGWTPLHHTGQHNRVEAAKLLLAAGADPLIESELTSPSCTTPLDEARKYKKGKDVAELLAKAAAPRIKATEREVRKVAEAFGRAVRDSDDKALLTVTHQPPHMGVKNVWTQWAGTIRKEYATGPELLDTVDSVFSRGVWAEAYIPRPAGDKNSHMILLLMRWPDGTWRVLERHDTTDEPAKVRGQRIRYARSIYQRLYTKVYPKGARSSGPRPAPAASGGRPKASTDRDAPPAVSATGQVVDASGNPVAGAVVRAYEPHQDETGRTTDVVLADKTTTKADGSFRLTWKPGRTAHYWPILIARKPGMALGWRDWDYRKMADLHVTIALLKPTKLAGVVVDEQGRPVSGAVVRAELKRPDKDDTFGTWVPRRRPLEWLTAETDESGRFSFHEVPVGVGAEFFVTAPGRAKLSTRSLRPASFKPQFAAGRTDIRITLPLEAIIAGTVVDKAAGTGVAGVRVRTHRRGWSYFHEPTAVSDTNGRFRLEGLLGGTHRLELVRSRRRLADWVVEKTEVQTAPGKMTSGAKLAVRKGGVLEVTVVSRADGKGIPDAFVSAGPMYRSAGTHAYTHTNARGVAKLRVLPGRYRFSVGAPGY